MRVHRPVRAILLFLAALLLPVSAAAQRVGASVGVASSDYRELASPLALGLHASVPLVGWLHARADVRRYPDGQRWTRSTCQGLVPPDRSCPDDLFEGDFTLHAFGAGLTVVATLEDAVTAGLGAQRSWTWVDGAWRGRESGITMGWAPDQRKAGWSYLASITYDLAPGIGLSAEGRVDHPEIRDCVVDGYSGFCEQHPVRSLQLGVALRR